MTNNGQNTLLRLLIFNVIQDSAKRAKLILDKSFVKDILGGKPEAILALVQAIARCSESTEGGDENEFRIITLGAGAVPQTSLLYKKTDSIIAIALLTYPLPLRRQMELFLNDLVSGSINDMTEEHVDELLKAVLSQR